MCVVRRAGKTSNKSLGTNLKEIGLQTENHTKCVARLEGETSNSARQGVQAHARPKGRPRGDSEQSELVVSEIVARLEGETSNATRDATASPGRWPAPSERLWRARQKVAHPAGVEPATFGLGIQRSIQLSYGCLKARLIPYS